LYTENEYRSSSIRDWSHCRVDDVVAATAALLLLVDDEVERVAVAAVEAAAAAAGSTNLTDFVDWGEVDEEAEGDGDGEADEAESAIASSFDREEECLDFFFNVGKRFLDLEVAAEPVALDELPFLKSLVGRYIVVRHALLSRCADLPRNSCVCSSDIS
jgi:hypothetical protein